MKLKICGVRTLADVVACAEAGVEAVGINLWPGSKRGLSLAAASELTARWPTPGPARVGVFVDPSLDHVRAAMEVLGLDAVQLHGDAPVAPVADAGLPYVWVIRGTPALDGLLAPKPAPTWILLDAAVRGYGGAGARTDWDWAAEAVATLAPTPVWLAGGIDPDNAADAIARVKPAGLDVASGAERPGDPPGIKDPHRIAALAAICKNRSTP